MATIRLVPSTTAVNNESYASIANANNMYTNTDSTTYGTFTHNRASTNNTYYGYIRGFNFSAVPADATVSSFTVKIKASATGHTTSTSSSYYMSLINNTT
jgi:phospholipase/lecithinase/hemolysin